MRKNQHRREVGAGMSTRDLVAFNAIINSVYESSSGASPWNSFLRRIKDATGSVYAWMAFADEHSQAWNERRHYLENDSSRPLDGRHDRSDFLRVSPFTALPQGMVRSVRELAKEGRAAHFEFRDRAMKPFGLGDIIGVNFIRDDGQVGSLRLGRPQTAQPYSRKEKDLCLLLLPHLRRASADVSARRSSAHWRSILFEICRALGIGIFLIDPDHHVHDANDFAMDLLRVHDQILSVRKGQLHVQARGDDRAFIRAVADTFADGGSHAFRATGSAARDHLFFVCTTLAHEAPTTLGRRAIVFVGDSSLSRPIDAGVLRDLFALSRAEADVVLGLTSGLSIAEIASQNATSRNTVYSQLKAVFEKVGVGQQSVLVSRVLSSIAILGRS